MWVPGTAVTDGCELSSEWTAGAARALTAGPSLQPLWLLSHGKEHNSLLSFSPSRTTLSLPSLKVK